MKKRPFKVHLKRRNERRIYYPVRFPSPEIWVEHISDYAGFIKRTPSIDIDQSTVPIGSGRRAMAYADLKQLHEIFKDNPPPKRSPYDFPLMPLYPHMELKREPIIFDISHQDIARAEFDDAKIKGLIRNAINDDPIAFQNMLIRNNPMRRYFHDNPDRYVIMDDLDQDDEENRGCERCKCCDTYWEECEECGGEGMIDGEALMEEDPLWYMPHDSEECQNCDGKGGWTKCLGNCDENGKHESK